LSQPEAAQARSPVEHTVLQQLPMPAMPHCADAHCPFDVQGEPAARPLVAPVVAPVVPPVLPPFVATPVVPPVVVPPSVAVDEPQATRKPNPIATTAAANPRM
jgi:hypothetical protein